MAKIRSKTGAQVKKYLLYALLLLAAVAGGYYLTRNEGIRRKAATLLAKEYIPNQNVYINDLLAGKMEDGKDWCPTYLTSELENTEFGDLLTITDILLKDWSESGTIQEMYYRYPEPAYYPFRKPLFRLLGLNELVYNWNTADVMYAIDIATDKSLVAAVQRRFTLLTGQGRCLYLISILSKVISQ
jgi:hypothetical protein